ncbi:MAG: hypothetical protein K2K56_10220 [Lachnospiraceae bacterium]|nr:hypothetical protein [Lachnospiraceae bacterium]
MDKYIVVSDDGYYAKRILEEFPNYQGIDRFPWPLGTEDIKKIEYLPDKDRACAKQYIKEMKGVGITDIYCNDFSYAYQYAQLCRLLKINANVYMSRLCDGKIPESGLLEVNENEYLFVGYDYVLGDAAYSCIIHEKYLCDRIEKIELNQNGLLSSFQDARRFADLREQAKKENNGDGFEVGSDGTDFHIIALFLIHVFEEV